MPPPNPCPNSRPNKPAPRKPPARPPSSPPPKRPGGVAARPAVLEFPGCASVRCIGAAEFGAVCVTGGAEKVRVPRLPPENPPPTRACASAAISKPAAAIAATRITKRRRIIVARPANGGQEDRYRSVDLQGGGTRHKVAGELSWQFTRNGVAGRQLPS